MYALLILKGDDSRHVFFYAYFVFSVSPLDKKEGFFVAIAEFVSNAIQDSRAKHDKKISRPKRKGF